MLLTINVWFFGVLLTSVTGSVAYGLWKLLERLFKRRRQYNWLMISSKLTVLFWIVPVVFLVIYLGSYRQGAWTNEAFLPTPSLLIALRVCFLIWLAGFLWQVKKYFQEKYRLCKLKKANISAASGLREALDEMKGRLKVRNKVQINGNLLCRIPQVSGLLYPAVMLPAKEWEQNEARIVIGHELMHIKHRDLLWKYFLAWVKRIQWFNPVFSLMVSDIFLWNEICCDRDMCGRKDSPFAFEEYFDTVLAYSKEGKEKNASFLSGTLYENKESVKRRILSLKDYRFERETKGWAAALLSVLFVAMVFFTSYAAGEGVLGVYNRVREKTEVLIIESPESQNTLTEEIIPAETDSGVVEIEVPESRKSNSFNWDIPLGTLISISGFSCNAGDEIVIMAVVEPDNKLTRVGITEPDGTRRSVSSTGTILYSFEVKKRGVHQVYVENQSDTGISVLVTYSSN